MKETGICGDTQSTPATPRSWSKARRRRREEEEKKTALVFRCSEQHIEQAAEIFQVLSTSSIEINASA